MTSTFYFVSVWRLQKSHWIPSLKSIMQCLYCLSSVASSETNWKLLILQLLREVTLLYNGFLFLTKARKFQFSDRMLTMSHSNIENATASFLQSICGFYTPMCVWYEGTLVDVGRSFDFLGFHQHTPTYSNLPVCNLSQLSPTGQKTRSLWRRCFLLILMNFQ